MDSMEKNMIMQDSAFDALIQWCLIFNKPLSQIELVDSTPCTLHGMVVWQNLDDFLCEDFSEGLIADPVLEDFGADGSVVQGGITSTLGQLRKGKVKARLTLEFSPENKKQKVLRNVSWQDIAGTPLKPWLKTLQNQIREEKRADSAIAPLAGLSRRSGYFCERSLKYKAALAAARGVSVNEIPLGQVYRFLAREIVDKKEYVGRGGSARVALYNEQGELVTTSIMTLN
jgi:hypothetical protein